MAWLTNFHTTHLGLHLVPAVLAAAVAGIIIRRAAQRGEESPVSRRYHHVHMRTSAIGTSGSIRQGARTNPSFRGHRARERQMSAELIQEGEHRLVGKWGPIRADEVQVGTAGSAER